MASDAAGEGTQSPLRFADDPLVKEVQSEFARLVDQSGRDVIPDIVVKHFFHEMLQDGVIRLSQEDDLIDPESLYVCPDGDALRGRILDRFMIETERRAVTTHGVNEPSDTSSRSGQLRLPRHGEETGRMTRSRTKEVGVVHVTHDLTGDVETVPTRALRSLLNSLRNRPATA